MDIVLLAIFQHVIETHLHPTPPHPLITLSKMVSRYVSFFLLNLVWTIKFLK